VPDTATVPDQAWLSEHVGHAEREAFAAIDRFAPTPSQAGLLKTILSSMLDRGVCRMALQLPLLVHFGIRGAPDGTIHQLAAALALLEAGIYTLDHIVDMEVDGPLLELPGGTVLLGAVCLISHLPNQVILALPRDAELTAGLARIFADGLARIGAGQLEDIATASQRAPSSRRIEHAVTLKTGERRALFTTMAAVLADGTPAQVEAYAEFGRALGIARQLRSDLADLFGAIPSRDLASRVLTLPLALYLEGGDEARTAEMEQLLASAGKHRAVQRQICDRLRDSGTMREVVRRIERQCALALDRLDRVQPVAPVAPLLRALVLSASVVATPAVVAVR
jgi:hypothetical protein